MNNTVAMLIFNWAKTTFGDGAINRNERAIRNVEEAVEAAQAVCVEKDMVLRTVERVYTRPVGEIDQELGGNLITLLSFCYAVGYDPEVLLFNELNRVTSKPVDEWKKKHGEKVVAGTAYNPLNEVVNALERYAKDHIEKANDPDINSTRKQEQLTKADENKRLAEIIRDAIS